MAVSKLGIPESTSTVQVRIIDSTSRIKGIPMTIFMEPEIKGHDFMNCPAFSFLIEHPNGTKLLFDLGVRKDWENLSPLIFNRIKKGGWSVTVEKGVADLLQDRGIDPASINAIIWSHFHWDHTGDPSTFPKSTDLVVGPGFKKALTPAYPANQESPILESDYAGRHLREISFDSDLQIGGYNAFDYFGDGSLYLLDSPGHAIGHMCALARTTAASPSTFIFLGGDCAHHAGEFRPSSFLPLPSTISPSPLPRLHPNICPGSLFIPIHRLYDPSNRVHATDTPTSEPFFRPAAPGASDLAQARDSATKLCAFDGHEDVLVMIAHDRHMLDVVKCFPEKANGWKEEGWKEKGKWIFLGDFEMAVEESEEKGREGRNMTTSK